MKEALGLDFITRTLKTSGVLLLITIPFGIYYFGFYATLGVLSGGVWGLVNLFLLKFLIVSAVRPGGADWPRAAALLLLAFPLLFLAGYFLLTIDVINALHLLIGFSIPMLVMVLKVLGRLFLKLNKPESNSETLQGAL